MVGIRGKDAVLNSVRHHCLARRRRGPVLFLALLRFAASCASLAMF
jgi:hypothetical protein